MAERRNKKPSVPLMTVPEAAQEQAAYQARVDAAIVAEEHVARRWGFGQADRAISRLFDGGPFLWAVLVLTMAVMFVFGRYGPSFQQEQDQARVIANALKTAVPVVSATEVSMDPGKYVGKLIDVVMPVTIGGVSRSGKSVYLQEYASGLSLVFFESAFESFGGAETIAPRFLGKTVRVRGTVRQFQDRVSIPVFAPGLITEVDTTK